MWKLLKTHLSQNKWHIGTSEKSKHQKIAIRTHFHAWYDTETNQVFLTADGKTSWLLLPSLASLLSSGSVQPESIYFCILKVTFQVWESQKRINININHSYQQSSSLWFSHNWSNWSNDSVLSNPPGTLPTWLVTTFVNFSVSRLYNLISLSNYWCKKFSFHGLSRFREEDLEEKWQSLKWGKGDRKFLFCEWHSFWMVQHF